MANSHSDQLVAAVNDQMDPITLLVWCEENLSPEQLPTLKKLLRSDDGTLARDIGWNLLEMILAILEQDPPEAVECLDCIARRGNPREVVVKVAEVLEKLGEDAGASEVDEDSVDELPTFAGEADRIHLGPLNLDGEPALEDTNSHRTAQDHQGSDETRTESHYDSSNTLQFQVLMSMLSILHLRIKTQYPSRFLATSLPAALGAYRRIDVNALSTFAFLSFLGGMSGRKPQLPARRPSASRETALSQEPASLVNGSSMPTVLMPDSEAEVEGSSFQQASQNEKDIVLKLLQAVLLEALDDYMVSLQSSHVSHMSWTTRLREKAEPRRLLPGKIKASQKWRDSKSLNERDGVLEGFLTVANDLRLDVDEHFGNLLDKDGSLLMPASEMEDTQALPEYPTNPSQVPFPPSGLLFLYTAQQYYSRPAVSQSEPSNTWALASRSYQFFRSEQNAAYLQASFATEDALLLLLYLTKDKPQPVHAASDFDFIFMSLATFSAEFPDPQLRDAAHSIATVLFHNHPDTQTKLQLISGLLKHEKTPANLKAVAIGWIKDEIAMRPNQDPCFTAHVRIRHADLDSELSLLPLLFPAHTSVGTLQSTLEKYDVSELSYYIASLNLVYVLAGETASARTTSAMETVVTGLKEWRLRLRDLEDEPADEEVSSEIKVTLDECRLDLFALDDALERASNAMKRPKSMGQNGYKDTEACHSSSPS